MKRLLALALLFSAAGLLTPVLAADAKDKAKAKEALQALNDYIGSYKANGAPDKLNPDPKTTWSEELNWGWKFKGDDAWMRLEIKNGKYFKGGDLRYLTDKGKYQLAMATADGQEQVFVGDLKNEILTLDHTDPNTKAVTRLKMNMAGEGARFIYRTEKKRGTLYVKDTLVAASKEGESIAGGGKKNECVVTGGLGTMAVSFMGETFYVCCSGCREAFQEDPAKFVKEFKAKKKK